MATVTVAGDPTGATVSSVAISTAISAAGVGGTVIFPAGTFLIDGPIYPLTGQTLIGQGIDVTTLRIKFSAILNFPYLSMLQGINTNPNVTVQDVTLNGGRSDVALADRVYDATTCPYGYGGGVSADIGWLVQRCRFTNINAYKVGVFGSHGATVADCIFDQIKKPWDAVAPTSGDPDNIGGGQGACGVSLLRNFMDKTCVGSGIDITNGCHFRFIDNEIQIYSLILEGLSFSEVRGNRVSGGGNINIKPNTGYDSCMTNGMIMPNNIVIADNYIIGANSPGIVVVYDSNYRGTPVIANNAPVPNSGANYVVTAGSNDTLVCVGYNANGTEAARKTYTIPAATYTSLGAVMSSLSNLQNEPFYFDTKFSGAAQRARVQLNLWQFLNQNRMYVKVESGTAVSMLGFDVGQTSGKGVYNRYGGNLRIENNSVVNCIGSGILIAGVTNWKSQRDIIQFNRIYDVTPASTTSPYYYNSGLGQIPPCCVSISEGDGDVILGNTFIDTRVSTTWPKDAGTTNRIPIHGVCIGAKTQSGHVRRTVVKNNVMQGCTGALVTKAY